MTVYVTKPVYYLRCQLSITTASALFFRTYATSTVTADADVPTTPPQQQLSKKDQNHHHVGWGPSAAANVVLTLPHIFSISDCTYAVINVVVIRALRLDVRIEMPRTPLFHGPRGMTGQLHIRKLLVSNSSECAGHKYAEFHHGRKCVGCIYWLLTRR